MAFSSSDGLGPYSNQTSLLSSLTNQLSSLSFYHNSFDEYESDTKSHQSSGSQEDFEQSLFSQHRHSPIYPEGMCKLFVGQIPSHMEEDQVRSLFEPFGEVTYCTVLRDKHSKMHLGCAFLTLSRPEDAMRAIEALHDKVQLHPSKRNLVVRHAGSPQQPSDWKLFIGMLARTTSEEGILRLFSPYGHVKEIHLMRDQTGQSKGCAFVKYSTRDAAVAAIGALHDLYHDPGAPRNLIVKFAEKRSEKNLKQQQRLSSQLYQLGAQASQQHQQQQRPFSNPTFGTKSSSSPPPSFPRGFVNVLHQKELPSPKQNDLPWPTSPEPFNSKIADTRGPPGANLFVYNFPTTFRDESLLSLFSSFGTVLSTKVYVDKMTGLSRGFGFVSFSSPAEAQRAILSLNGYEIGGKRLKVAPKKSDELYAYIFSKAATPPDDVYGFSHPMPPMTPLSLPNSPHGH